MKVIKPPEIIPKNEENKFLFLAGSIEMGKASDWQKSVEEALKDTNWTILNPRRDNWDSSWEQTIENEKFREQVEWELDALNMADKILFYFEPNTKSPVTLLELGLHASGGKVIVCCPDGFWRKGNVEIVCKKYNIPLFTDLTEAIKEL